MKILQAIEDGDFAGFHSAFLYRSFVRQFAKEVGLNMAELDSEIQESAKRIAEPLLPGQSSFQPKIPALNLGRPAKVRWGYSLASLFLMLAICSGIHALWQSSKSSARNPVNAASLAAADVSPSGGVNDDGAMAPAQSAEPGDTLRAAPAAGADSNEGFRIELSAIERTWLSIKDDGRQIFNGILGASQTKVLVAQRTARIRTGNAGGVSVVFNGRTLGPLGARGQVATIVFTAKGYKIFEPSARITPVEFIPSGE